MPKFKDNRKSQQAPFFNGWVDENEPRSPLAELFSKLTPVMSVMKRKGTVYIEREIDIYFTIRTSSSINISVFILFNSLSKSSISSSLFSLLSSSFSL